VFIILPRPARLQGQNDRISDELMENRMMNLKMAAAVVLLGLMSGVTHADEMAKDDGMMKHDKKSSMSGHKMKKDDMSGAMGDGMKDKSMMKDDMHGAMKKDSMKKDGMMKDDMQGGMKEDGMMKDDSMAK
jgi:hypothetical protein